MLSRKQGHLLIVAMDESYIVTRELISVLWPLIKL
jgi:hypothetical protein